ncbi:unnamed protein product, partial [Closterium sp. NIES-53]
RQDGATLWAHASGALKAPLRPDPLPTDPEPTPAAQADYDRRVLARDVWDSHDAATALALTELLPPTEAVPFAQVDTAQGIWDAVCCALFHPFLCLPQSPPHALLVIPPPMWLTVHWLVTRLPDRLATARNVLLYKHPSELTIDLLETALGKIESNLLFVASATDAVPPPVFLWGVPPLSFPLSLLPALLLLCRLLRTLLLSLALSGRNGARVARRAGREVEEAVVVAEAALVPQEEGALEEVQDRQARLLAVFRPAGVSDLSSSSHSSTSHSRDSSTSRDSSSSRHCSSSSLGDPHCNGVCSSTEAPRRSACVSALGACVASTSGSPQAVASLSFMLDSGASQCFFRDHTTLTPLLAPVPVALADPSSGPAMARSSTTLPCPMVPSGVLCGLHIPSFTRNLVGVGYLQDKGITVTFVGGGRTAVCTDAVTGRVLATFTREPRSDLYVLHTEHSPVSTSPEVVASPHVPAPPPVVKSSQVVASPPVVVSGQVVASFSCQSFTHRTILWHHRLGHPSIPRLRTMASHRLVSSLPRVLPSLPPSPAPPCTPCVAGRLRAAPHSSSLRPATAPFQTLHLDVWGPAPTQGPERERYFLVVVDDFSRYTTVFPLAKKFEVTSTLIRWLLATEGTRGRRVSCVHSDRGGEFCSGILAGFCGEQGIVQSWTLSESPQQNGVAEHRIGLVMDI